MSSDIPSVWIRRPIAIGILLIAAALLPFLLPPALIAAFLADLVLRTTGLRWTRSVLLVATLIMVEIFGLLLILGVWLTAPLGLGMQKPRVQRRCQTVMRWWAGRLMWTATAFLPMHVDTSELDDELLRGNAIVIGRHRSVVDAIVPAVVFAERGTRVLYTLKEDLRWEPNIDLVGHIMRHRFVTRSPKDLAAELDPLRTLAGRLDDETVAVIFPEGTFFSEARKAKIVKSLQDRQFRHAGVADALNHLLAPRPAGTLALLEGAPEADVIIFGHIGFENYGSLSEIFSRIGHPTRVLLRAWRVPRSELPTDHDEQIDWLFDAWTHLDRWITEQHRTARVESEVT